MMMVMMTTTTSTMITSIIRAVVVIVTMIPSEAHWVSGAARVFERHLAIRSARPGGAVGKVNEEFGCQSVGLKILTLSRLSLLVS